MRWQNLHRTRGLEKSVRRPLMKPDARSERIDDGNGIDVVEIAREGRRERRILHQLEGVADVFGAYRLAVMPSRFRTYVERHRERVGRPGPAIRQPWSEARVGDGVQPGAD